MERCSPPSQYLLTQLTTTSLPWLKMLGLSVSPWNGMSPRAGPCQAVEMLDRAALCERLIGSDQLPSTAQSTTWGSQVREKMSRAGRSASALTS